MIRRFALLPSLLACVAPASAALFVFDENAIPTNPVNGFGSFTFGGLGGGAVTDGPTSLIIDASSFGGIGVDYVIESPPTSGMFVPQNFDPTTHRLEMRIKLLEGNAAAGINAGMVDDDGAGAADDHQFGFSLAGVPMDGQFHIITASLLTPSFTGTAFGFTAGDGVVNPGFRQMQIQSQFGSSARLHVEVDYLQIAEIPEPAAAVLSLVAVAGLATRRQR